MRKRSSTLAAQAPKEKRVDRGLALPTDGPPARTRRRARKADSAASGAISQTAQRPFPIVGIGASAGGLEAFSQLLEHLPPDTGMGLVLVQHLDPSHSSALTELLGRTTRLPVTEVKNGTVVEPNHVYVIPPNVNMFISRGVLRLQARHGQAPGHRSIDMFFNSLAQDQGHQAIGVILSGTATDGTLGLEAIKAEGGIAFAQEEKSARYDGMPRSAIASGCVDFVLTPQEIGYELHRLSTHPYIVPATTARAPELPDESSAFKRILSILRQRTGLDFTAYKTSTLHRRIARRLALSQKRNLDEYVTLLRDKPAEVDALYEDLLINVTSFFRDPGNIEFLKKKVFPKICLQARPEEPLRMWVAGCSSGQEPYSLAMAFLEFAESRKQSNRLQIFGTDANEAGLEKARAAIYPKALLADVSPQRLRRFFVEASGGHYAVSKTVREMCVFARHNLIADPPFSRLDLISCRNLLIYLEPDVQKKIMPIFHYALKPGGFLWLGTSESVGGFADLFAPLNKRNKIYIKKSAAAPRTFSFPRSDRSQTARQKKREPGSGVVKAFDPQREGDRILLARYAPASVLINDEMEVLQFRGDTGVYLKPAPGKPTMNLLKMLREGLMLPVRAMIQKARREKNPVMRASVRFKQNGGMALVKVGVLPLKHLPTQEAHYVVTFEPPAGGALAGEGASHGSASAKTKDSTRSKVNRGEEFLSKAAESGAIRRLTDELADTKDYLQSVIEQYDAASEELQSAGEEAQSSNEELQSINEELETSKEELQASNEELSTVNQELQNRNTEVSALNDDLLNLLSSVSIPVVMVGRDLRIRRITPAAEKALNVIGSDIGRLISDVKLKVEIPGLEEVIAEVIDTITSRELEVQDRQGRWQSVRVRPYKTMENRIDGAVIALVDVDALKRSEQRAQQARDYAEAIVDTVREGMVVLDSALRVQKANNSFYETFRLNRSETEGRIIYELNRGQWNIPALRTLLEEILPENPVFNNFEIEQRFDHIGDCTMLVNARKVLRLGEAFVPYPHPQRAGARGPNALSGPLAEGNPLILLAIEDITERRKNEQALRGSEVRYRRLFESAKDGMLILDPEKGKIIDCNPRMTDLLGYSREEFLGRELWEIGLLENQAASHGMVRELESEAIFQRDNLKVRRKSGETIDVEVISNRYEEEGRPVIQCNVRDVSERQHILEQLHESEKFRRLMVDSVRDHAIFTLDVNGRVNTWNKGAERMFGFEDAEILGQDGAILFTPEDRAAGIPEEEMETAATSGPAIDERWHIRKDGSRFLASGEMTPMRDQAGELRGFTKVARDITEREKSRAALTELARLLDLSNDAVIVRDIQHRITYWNHGSHELYGWTAAEALGQNLHELLKCNFPKPLETIFAKLKKDRRWSGEVVQTSRHGDRVTVASRWALDCDAEGNPSAILETDTDITERKRVDDALKDAMDSLAHQASDLERLVNERTAELQMTNSQLEAFVYTIAHDLRAPLRAMQGFSTMLAEEVGPNASTTARDYLQRISRSAKFMDSLLMDLLSFSRVSQQRMDLTPVSLQSVIEATLAELGQEIQSRNGMIQTVPPLPGVLAHEQTLAHVLINLITNALKFMPPGVAPQVRIRAEEHNGRVRVWVEDNGLGIAPEHQEQIFRIFRRLHAEQYPGTGIGLAIVHRGIERMGGKVGVESKPGEGSRFWFELKKA